MPSFQREASPIVAPNRTLSDAWCVSKTFVVVAEEDDEVSPCQPRRAQSEPPQSRKEEQAIQELKELISSAEAAENELQEQLLVEEQFAAQTPNRQTVAEMERDLQDLMEKYEAAKWHYDQEAEACTRAQMRAASLQVDLREDIEKKSLENQQLEEECEELKLEIGSMKACAKKGKMEVKDMKKVATPMKSQRCEPGSAPGSDVQALVEAQRRRGAALIALSEARGALLGAKQRQEDAERAEHAATVELERKEAMIQEKLKNAKESQQLRENSLKKQLEKLDEGLDDVQRTKQDKEKRLKHWAEELQKGRSRHDKASAKASRAESKAISMQNEVETLVRKVQEVKDECEAADSQVLAARAEHKAAEKRFYLTCFLLLLISVLCAVGLFMS